MPCGPACRPAVQQRSRVARPSRCGSATRRGRCGSAASSSSPIRSGRGDQRRRAAARRRPACALAEMPPIDVVLVTHDHRDHMDLPTLGKLPDSATYVVPLGNGERACSKPNVVELDWWQTHTIGDARDHARARAALVDARAVESQRHAVGRLRHPRRPRASRITRATPRWGDHFAEIGQRFGRSTGRCCRSAPTRRAGSWSRSTSIRSRRRAAFDGARRAQPARDALGHVPAHRRADRRAAGAPARVLERARRSIPIAAVDPRRRRASRPDRMIA